MDDGAARRRELMRLRGGLRWSVSVFDLGLTNVRKRKARSLGGGGGVGVLHLEGMGFVRY